MKGDLSTTCNPGEWGEFIAQR